MTETRPVLDEVRLRRLVDELHAVVKREVPWYEGNQHDPGLTLLDLFAFLGDALLAFENRATDEAYLRSRRTWGLILRNLLGTSSLAVTVDGSLWREVESLGRFGPDAAVYVAKRGADGSTTVRFGDGRQGRRPPAGAQVAATYHHDGGVGVIATIPWPPAPPLSLEVHASPERLSLVPARRSWRDCLTRWFVARR